MKQPGVMTIVRPMAYNSDMSLIIATICKDGILVSGDRLGVKIEDNKPEPLTKVFPLNDWLIWGYTGENLKDPSMVHNLLNSPNIFTPSRFADTRPLDITAKDLAEVMASIHKAYDPGKMRMNLIVAAYDKGEPKLYTAKIIDCVVEEVKERPESYAIGEKTEYVTHRILNTRAKTLAGARQQHSDILAKTAENHPDRVSPTYDEISVGLSGISFYYT
jgi:20S proteasome alpha/beta subunit